MRDEKLHWSFFIPHPSSLQTTNHLIGIQEHPSALRLLADGRTDPLDLLADGRTPRWEPAVLGDVPRGAALAPMKRTACQEPTRTSDMRSRFSSPTRNGATDPDVGGHCHVCHTLVGQTSPSASVSKRQIGERKLRRGDTVYDMKVSPRKAGRADCETNLTIVKTRWGVAHFFHNGPSAPRNNMA
jgi:hypothetical protein